MTEKPNESATAPGEDVDQLQGELDRLKEENERLKADVVPDSVRHERTVRTWRWVIAGMLIVVGSLLAFFAIGAYWVNTFVMDTDTFVETLAPLSQDPRIQAAVVDKVDEALFTAVDVEGQIENILIGLQDAIAPELAKRGISISQLPVTALAAPLANTIQNAIREQTQALVASPQFSELWATALREGHQGMLRALEGGQQAAEAGLISVEGDTVNLNVNAFANAVKTRLVANGFGFLEKIPLTRAQGEVQLFQSPVLFEVLAAIRILGFLSWMLPLLALVVLVGAVFTSPDRRKGILFVGIGLLSVTLFGLLGINVGREATAQIATTQGLASAAIVAAYDILPRGLVTLLRLFLAIGLLTVLAAVLTGPARWAIAFRTWLSQLVEGTGPGAEFAQFVGKWRTPLAGGGVLLGILAIVVLPNLTAMAVFWIAVVVVLWVFAIETIGRRGAPAGGSGSQA